MLSDRKLAVLPCVCATNVGQIAAKTVQRLAEQQVACAISVNDLPTYQHNRCAASRFVALDGCGVGCAKQALLRAGLQVDAQVIVTEHQIRKGAAFEAAHVDRLTEFVVALLARIIREAK